MQPMSDDPQHFHSSPPPTLTLNQVTLRYHDELLFNNLHVEFPARQWTVLLGPSGVGKTSLLRFIAGLASDAYSLELPQASDGLPVSDRVVYLPQHDALLPWYSVLDNAVIGAKLRGETPPLAMATALLQRVGLGNALHKKPVALSGGMRQRVALVRVLLEDRPIVVMDEPFSAVDAITRLQLQDLAADLLKDRSVILVTHDPLEALRLGDIVYVLAGKPATLSAPLRPDGDKPRALDDPKLLQLHGALLQQLARAKWDTP